MPKRPASTSRADARSKTKSKLRQDVEALVRDHFALINDNPDRIHEAVASTSNRPLSQLSRIRL